MTVLESARRPRIVRIEGDFPGARLDRIWETRPGLGGWLSSVDHKEIGKRYIVTAFVFLILGGLEALVMRLQLAGPERRLLTPEQYDQLFTMHGVTMIFLYAAPILTGFSNYLWPMLLGSRDMAFPRLNALSYWIYVAAGGFMYAGFVAGHGADDGWFNYVPYASREFSPGINIDVYALGLILLGISTTVGSANFVVSFLRTRAPGMSINRVPILTWGTLTASVANLLALPSVSLAFFLLWMDRQFGTHFFGAAEGQPLLWQHLFWMFGHPWVYAIVLPAMGMVSDALPTFCRRPLVGYTLVALSTVGTMALGFGVWDHHQSQRSGGICVDRDDLDRASGDLHRIPVFCQHDRAVRHRRGVGGDDRVDTGRSAADADVFRRRAHPLCADRDQRLSSGRRGLLLVSQDDRAAAR
jgi:cytochrome c oxidase subunit 1/cytochrome c oxidase subunit I+III